VTAAAGDAVSPSGDADDEFRLHHNIPPKLPVRPG
jgi:hypothetical protein